MAENKIHLEVRQTEPTEEQKRLKKSSSEWGLYVNGVLFGTSKNRFDADHGKAILEGALYRVSCGLDSVPDATGDSHDPTVQKVNNDLPWPKGLIAGL